MNKLVQEANNYKHYFIVLVALLIANYVVMPLSDWQVEQQQKYSLLKKRSSKIELLVENKEQYDAEFVKIDTDVEKITQYIYTDSEEAKFKLLAQSKIEKILKDSECNVDRIGFKGNTIIDDSLSKWRVEIRFNGDAVCMTKTVRLLESSTPKFNINNYNANHRGFDNNAAGSFVTVMNLDAWHISGGK